MNNNAACAKYFRGQPAYDRLLREIWKKWESYGRVTGRVTLKNTSEEERRAIGGILGRTFYEQEIRVSCADFERGLQRTRFAPVDMKAVLEAYFHKPLLTHAEQKLDEQHERDSFLEEIAAELERLGGGKSRALSWIQALSREKKYGYSILLREYGRDREQAVRMAVHVGEALLWIEDNRKQREVRPLAVLAADISDNPHYFDRGTAAGQLLVHGICHGAGKEMPESAHQWRRLLMGVGIAPDNVSSLVHVYGLRLRREDGWHPACEAFCRLGEPYVLTMENLRGITGACAVGKRAYVVENEMVFSYLLEHAKNQDFTLLCTSGQLRSAALELMDLLKADGTRIYYSSDTDPDGIGIADRLWQQFGDTIQIWRMSPEDYADSLSAESFGAVGAAKLAHIGNPLLARTVARLQELKRCGYQENILTELLADLDQA